MSGMLRNWSLLRNFEQVFGFLSENFVNTAMKVRETSLLRAVRDTSEDK